MSHATKIIDLRDSPVTPWMFHSISRLDWRPTTAADAADSVVNGFIRRGKVLVYRVRLGDGIEETPERKEDDGPHASRH